MPDGFLAQPWRAIIGNRSEKTQEYSLRVFSDSPDDVRLVGPVQGITVAPNEHREITFLVCQRPGRTPLPVRLQLFSGGQPVDTVTLKP